MCLPLCWDSFVCFLLSLQLGNFAAAGLPVFSGVQVKAATPDARAGQFTLNKLYDYGAHVLSILSLEVPVAGGIDRVFVLLNGHDLNVVASGGANPKLGITAHQATTLRTGGTFVKNGVTLQRTYTAAAGVPAAAAGRPLLLARLSAHLTAAALAAGAPGSLARYYDVCEPQSADSKVAYRAYVGLKLNYLDAAGILTASPHVDQTACDVLWSFDGGVTWWRIELKSLVDRTLLPRNVRWSYSCPLTRVGIGSYSSEQWDALVAMHQPPGAGHPSLPAANLPINERSIVFIPVSAALANHTIDMDPTWIHPVTLVPLQRPARGALGLGSGWTAATERNDSFLLLSHQRPGTNRLQYNNPVIAFPLRSVHRVTDWAREFVVPLLPIGAQAPLPAMGPPPPGLAQRLRQWLP